MLMRIISGWPNFAYMSVETKEGEDGDGDGDEETEMENGR